MGEASTAEKRTKCIWVQPEAVAPIEVLANNLAKGSRNIPSNVESTLPKDFRFPTHYR